MNLRIILRFLYSTIVHYEWENAVKKDDHSSATSISLLSWEKPDPGLFKLNVDGTGSSTGLIGAGGVITDWNGNWFHG